MSCEIHAGLEFSEYVEGIYFKKLFMDTFWVFNFICSKMNYCSQLFYFS